MAESTTTKGHVLVVDDEEHITELVAAGLGFSAKRALNRDQIRRHE